MIMCPSSEPYKIIEAILKWLVAAWVRGNKMLNKQIIFVSISLFMGAFPSC